MGGASHLIKPTLWRKSNGLVTYDDRVLKKPCGSGHRSTEVTFYGFGFKSSPIQFLLLHISHMF